MRILLVTNVFPNLNQPTKGLINFHLARALSREHEVQVVSPISWFDEWLARRRGEKNLENSQSTVRDGMEVHYPRYVYPPGILRHRYHSFYWRSIRATVWTLLHTHLPDVVLGTWVYPDCHVATHIARLAGVPVGVIVGGADVLLLPKQQRWRRRIIDVLHQADAIFTASQHLKEMIGGSGVDPAKTHIWAPGIDGDRLSEVESHSTDWTESAQSLLHILQPLVNASQALDQPWWSGPTPAPIKPDTRVNPWSWRQQLRRGLASLLPRSRFLVRGPAGSNSICLTFDDGPHPEYTPALLETLRSHEVTATFFVVGRLVERYPDLVRRIAAEGHVVGNHSYLHAHLCQMSSREALHGILRTQGLLTQLLGQAPTLYRPPRGKVSALHMLGLWRHGLSVTLWNVDPRDYACGSVDELRQWFRQHPLQGSDIVLFHDRLPYAGAVLPDLIRTSRERGLTFAPVSTWTGCSGRSQESRA